MTLRTLEILAGNESVNKDKRQMFVWAWLRAALGVAQMTLAVTTFGLFLIVGFRAITWLFFGITISLTFISRFLYRDRKGPNTTEK